jgi:hypothetical protein
MSKVISRRGKTAQDSSTIVKTGTAKLATKLVDLAIGRTGIRGIAYIRDPSRMARLYLHAVNAMTGAEDRAVAALSLLRFQFLGDKTPSEVVDTFAGMANELRPQVDLSPEQF